MDVVYSFCDLGCDDYGVGVLESDSVFDKGVVTFWLSAGRFWFCWRREWDSNPRGPEGPLALKASALIHSAIPAFCWG
jgi:hypothetical protein